MKLLSSQPVRPTMIPVEPAFERIEQGAGACPVCEEEATPGTVSLFGWFRFPRLRRQKGLATGILGLW